MKRWIGLIMLAFAVGCGHQLPAPVHPPLKKIHVIPVHSPLELTARDHEGLYPGVNFIDALRLRDIYKNRGQKLTTALGARKDQLGQALSAALLKELEAQGYEVEMTDRIPGSAPDAPDDLDYTKFPSGPVLHVWFEEAGMSSPRKVVQFVPRINVGVVLTYPLDPDYAYSNHFYYGADAKSAESWSVPADPDHRFDSFDQVLADPGRVAEMLEAGMLAIARRISEDVKRNVK